MIQGKHLHPMVGVASAIAALTGMAIVSGVLPHPGKALLLDYSNSILTMQRFSKIDHHKVDSQRLEDGSMWVTLAPQSTQALHDLWGSPSKISEDGLIEYYVLEGTPGLPGTADVGMLAPALIAVHFEPHPDSNYELKATFAHIPGQLLRQPGQ